MPPFSELSAEKTPWKRVVFHVDMDAFYAAIEQRDHPEFRGQPVVVGGSSRRGVVATCSYEARKFGVHSAMPGFQARQLCPQAIFLKPRMRHYVQVSRQFMALLDRYSPLVEPLSLDEAFLDMSGTQELFGAPEVCARRLQEEVKHELGLGVSIGIAPNKFIAKIGSDLHKPAGIAVCPPGNERVFLASLAIERMWGVGPKAAKRLHQAGISKVGDIAASSLGGMRARFGSLGAHIWHLSQGQDVRPVSTQRQRKSLGAERTLPEDIVGEQAISAVLLPLVDEICAGLRKKKRVARGIRLKVKYADFKSVTRHQRFVEPTANAASFLRELSALLQRVDTSSPMRLVGVAGCDLEGEAAPSQLTLFSAEKKRQTNLSSTLDALNQRFGDGAVMRAVELERRAHRQPEGDPED